jgi:hypothetical protein
MMRAATMQSEAMWGHPQPRSGEGARSGAHDARRDDAERSDEEKRRS